MTNDFFVIRLPLPYGRGSPFFVIRHWVFRHFIPQGFHAKS